MNAFYYYYFLNQLGAVAPTPEEDWVNETLQFMTAPDSVCENAAGTLGISSLWLSSVPVIFTKKTFSLYIGSGKLSGVISPAASGILLKNTDASVRKTLEAISVGKYNPCETPPPKPYALLRAAAEKKQVDVATYIRTNFRYDDKDFTDTLIRNVILAGACPPSGSMEICDHAVIQDFAKVEDLTVDEACSGFEISDINCFVNLMIAFRLLVSRFNIQYNKDGSMLLSYPGYKLADFTNAAPAPRPRPDVSGKVDMIAGLDYM